MLRALTEWYRRWQRRRLIKRRQREFQVAIERLNDAFKLMSNQVGLALVKNLNDFADAYNKALQDQNHPYYLRDDHAGKDGKYHA